ncbi:oligopeptide ABC transporter permease [Halalkalibacter krulwichiae]|uniref:Dipeptide transport system permease protein DppC n=1 Tax=Halalkalibacter krulwichiae TaxID=199441 RepID=A0A1X9MHP9_9BACI|nr:oligopeptide ABC transporter permease [Halalkalibacter krulwichiae]ARK32194.1 Dipeptide transport system permease protein DppC [Halalkalibacter krulwichiae]
MSVQPQFQHGPEVKDNQVLGERRSLISIIVTKFFQNKLAVIGLVMLTLITLACVFAPVIAPHDPAYQDLRNRLAEPSAVHWLGTDHLGRDLFSRMLYGGQVSLYVGFASMLGAVTIGAVIGAIAGYFGGLVDAFLMRMVDVILAFPNIFLLITLVALLDPSINILILVFALLSWTGTARVVRGEFLTLKKREFVLASRTIGMSNTRIIFAQILPNALGPVIVAATLAVGNFILAESALSFFGLGVQPPHASWGNMLTDSQSITIFRTAWWYPTFPGMLILITVLCFNFIGDGLRDALDPRVVEK